MLANILKQINEAEEEADNIIAKANKDAQEIEKEAYIAIEAINNKTNSDIANAIAKLPKVQSATPKTVEIKVDEEKIKKSIELITTSLIAEFK